MIGLPAEDNSQRFEVSAAVTTIILTILCLHSVSSLSVRFSYISIQPLSNSPVISIWCCLYRDCTADSSGIETLHDQEFYLLPNRPLLRWKILSLSPGIRRPGLVTELKLTARTNFWTKSFGTNELTNSDRLPECSRAEGRKMSGWRSAVRRLVEPLPRER
jgi:hypothetical protein